MRYRPISPGERGREVAIAIHGTLDGLDEHACEEERANAEFMREVDRRVRRCQSCGQWFDRGEVDKKSGLCLNCEAA